MYNPNSTEIFADKLWVVFDNSRDQLEISDFLEEDGRYSDITWGLNLTVEFQKDSGAKIDFMHTPRGDLCISFTKVSLSSLETFFKYQDNHPKGYVPRITERNPILALVS